MIPRIWIGYDAREAGAFAVTVQSILDRSTVPVSITPLTLRSLKGFMPHSKGTNDFITSRYLIPALMDYSGWALFVDSDVLFREDVAELWALRDDRYALQCVWHNYDTKAKRKYKGSPIEADNVNYPRKNWSSVMMLNCAHPSNRLMTAEWVQMQTSQYLHRFEWLTDAEIGALPGRWNHLVTEEPMRDDAALVHWTLGVPGFHEYVDAEHSREWHATFLNAVRIIGESPEDVVRRAKERA